MGFYKGFLQPPNTKLWALRDLRTPWSIKYCPKSLPTDYWVERADLTGLFRGSNTSKQNKFSLKIINDALTTDWFSMLVVDEMTGDSSRTEKKPKGTMHHQAILRFALLFTSSGKSSESGKYQTSEKICKAKNVTVGAKAYNKSFIFSSYLSHTSLVIIQRQITSF